MCASVILSSLLLPRGLYSLTRTTFAHYQQKGLFEKHSILVSSQFTCQESVTQIEMFKERGGIRWGKIGHGHAAKKQTKMKESESIEARFCPAGAGVSPSSRQPHVFRSSCKTVCSLSFTLKYHKKVSQDRT